MPDSKSWMTKKGADGHANSKRFAVGDGFLDGGAGGLRSFFAGWGFRSISGNSTPEHGGDPSF